ncbi:MAG: hypothetical protein IKS99_02895 [Firmicutes bacterium]|nr:hypothetical protein [Bacillota bacterium]
MKDILLKPHTPYFNHVEIDVLDYPKGLNEEPRWRCMITVDYGKFDVDQLKAKGMGFEEVLDYYKDWIYKLVRARLLDEWTAVGGLDETLTIVEDHIKEMF